jgi:hypothetical protein
MTEEDVTEEEILSDENTSDSVIDETETVQ